MDKITKASGHRHQPRKKLKVKLPEFITCPPSMMLCPISGHSRKLQHNVNGRMKDLCADCIEQVAKEKGCTMFMAAQIISSPSTDNE